MKAGQTFCSGGSFISSLWQRRFLWALLVCPALVPGLGLLELLGWGSPPAGGCHTPLYTEVDEVGPVFSSFFKRRLSNFLYCPQGLLFRFWFCLSKIIIQVLVPLTRGHCYGCHKHGLRWSLLVVNSVSPSLEHTLKALRRLYCWGLIGT